MANTNELDKEVNKSHKDSLYDSFLPIGEHNPYIKQVKNLVNNTKPNPEKLFVAEGLWAFNKLVEFNVEIKSLVICKDHVFTHEAEVAIEKLSKRTNFKFLVSQKTFEKISERDKPDGLLAVAVLPQHKIEDFKPKNNAVVLVLDGIEIPGNIGTMVRMCDGAGADAVFVVNRKARLTHPKLIKGSMGAVLSVPIYEFAEIDDCYNWLEKNGFTTYLADTRATHHYYEEPFGKKTALVMGSERYGITRAWYSKPHVMISIPMLGTVDSLNVGVAATVLTYEATIKNKIINNSNKPRI